jgi:hypothetical protein
MGKRGRPKAQIETMQVAIRLPRVWVEQFRKSEGGVSKAIQERLARSTLSDATDPKMRELAGQIEQLARRVRRLYGAEWYEDQAAHKTFIETVKRLIVELPEPAERRSDVSYPSELAAEFIFKDYVAELQELEQGEVRMKPSIKTLMGGSDD